MRLGSERQWSRERIKLDGLDRLSQKIVDSGDPSLHDQMEEIFGEIWRQEAWAEIEDRIDVLLAHIRLSRG